MELEQIVEPCDRFPNGLWTGDEVELDYGCDPNKTGIITTREEWETDRASQYPPDRAEPTIPYTLDACNRPRCWRIDEAAVTIIKSIRIEANGQLLMF